MKKNKYSDLKIVWFNEKMKSLKDGNILAPICVRIKPTNRCCHNCFFCVYNYDFSKMHETTNRIDEIPVNKLLDILDDLKTIGTKAITYSGGGEPLMHRNIIEILDKTLEVGLDLSLLTNGQFITNKIAERLVTAKWIRISVDYFSHQSFIDSRGGNIKMFDNLIDNIKSFTSMNRSCEVGVNYIITKNNYKQLINSAEFLNKLGVDNIRYSPVWTPDFYNYHKEIENEVIDLLKTIREQFSNTMNIYDSYKIKEDVSKRSYHKCYFMQIVPVIGADLNIYNCHNKAYSTDGIIGSIKDKKFSEVWFSKETQNYFEEFRPDLLCNHQCANEKKNEYLNEIINCYGDNYV
jgi:MoaA/NifB/PqqE/SkfB family radical SAM enzyme